MSGKDPRSSRPTAAIRRVLHSFRFRLTLLFVVILALVLAVFSVFIYTRQAQILHAETVNRLTTQSTQLAAYYSAQLHTYEEDSEGRLVNGTQIDQPLLPENAILALVDRSGQILLQQASVQPTLLQGLIETWNNSRGSLVPLTFKLPARDAEEGAGETEYLFEVSPLQVEGERGGYILLAYPVDPEGQLQRLAISLALSSVLILLSAFGGGYWLADRAMKPVQTIVHAARSISESDLSRRLNLHREDELGELADTFDQMLDRLQAAFERQRQFTADASHELRSPLAIIELESNRALERGRKPEEYEEVLRLIQSENEWMSRLVNELLLLARMDAGQIAMRAERVDLSEIVVEVTERLNPLAQARGVALETGALVECYVQAERVYLEQLLTNLVENAIKYTQNGEAKVLVETGSQLSNEQQWRIVRVSDNGSGIPQEHLAHIFDRFYRTDKARQHPEAKAGEQISGSGLGLAIAKSIAEIYGGRIEVHSQPGEGTTFTVWLPAV